MPAPKQHPQRRRVIDVLCPADVLWRRAPLHPRHHAHQHVVLVRGPRVPHRGLPHHPRPRPTAAMAHAADAEEAVEGVHAARRQVHRRGHVVVVPRRVGRGYKPVLLAVVGEEFAAAGAEGGEVALPGGDVVAERGVEGVDVGAVGEGEVGVGEGGAGDDVFVPVLFLVY